jgi:peptide-methionine (R)-S-oxide reductase
MRIRTIIISLCLSVWGNACAQSGEKVAGDIHAKGTRTGFPAAERVEKTDAEWKRILPPEQYAVTRQKGTERPGSSPLLRNKEKGIYQCADCSLPLFESRTKFESGTGWPSFWAPVSKQHVVIATDIGFGMVRDEVVCARCGAHLGHVFTDGPKPTGLRYCMNGIALKFSKNE